MPEIHQFENIPGLRELNTEEKEKLASFLKSPGKGEFFFLLQMLGQSHLTTPNDCLPRLVEYLHRVGHSGTPESLLWAFHGPESDVTDL